MSLDRHINLGWQSYLCRELGEFIDIVPPQQRIDEHWYQGTADAVYQNIYTIEKERPDYVVILAGDHIYKMDYMKLVERHIETQADVTIGALRVDLRAAQQLGVMQIDADSRVVGFEEKPEQPKPMPGDSSTCAGLDGDLRLHGPLPLRAIVPRRHAARQQARLRPRRDPLGDPHAPHLRLSVPRREPQEGRLLARRGHAGRLLRGQHGPGGGRSATEPVRQSLADTHLSAQFAAAEVRVRGAGPFGPARPGLDSIVCAGSIVSGGQVERLDRRARTRGSTVTPRSRIPFFSTA